MIENVASEPIDEYLGPLTKVLGRTPGQAEVIALYKKDCRKLHKALESQMEMKLNPDLVKSILRQGIRNWFGPSVDPLVDK
jgi:hypothetical protein